MDEAEEDYDSEIVTVSDLVGDDNVEIINLDGTEPQNDGEESMEPEGQEPADSATDENIPTIRPITTFSQHSADVFSVAVTGTMVASGGEDDKAYVWDAHSGTVLLLCDGHNDSVTWVCFNNSGSLLATADMSGTVHVWDMTTLTRKTTFDSGDLEWLLWHKAVDILFAGTKAGLIFMWLVPSGDCKVYCGLGSTCVAGSLLPDGKKLCAGYEDGSVLIHDLRQATHCAISIPKNQVFPIVSITVSVDGRLGACGLSNGICHVFHCETGKVLNTLQCASKSEDQPGEEAGAEDENSVEAVAFSPSSTLLCTATVNGTCLLWNLNTYTVRQTLTHPDGISKAIWNGLTVATACLDGLVRLWDSRSGSVYTVVEGHSAEVLDFVFSSDKQFLVTASGDRTCKCFALQSNDMIQ